MARQAEAGQPLTPSDHLRLLLFRLSENWAKFRIFDLQKEAPWTDNGAEPVICRMKMRSRTVRGYKAESGILNTLMVIGSGIC